MFRSSRPTRSSRPFARARRSARKSSSPIPTAASAPMSKIPIPILMRSAHRSRAVRRGLSRLSAGAHRRNRALRRRHRVETAGRGPFAQRLRGDFAQPARPGARCHGDAAGRAAHARRREDLQLVNPHPESLGEITTEYPFLQGRYEHFRVAMHGRHTRRPRRARSLCFAKPKKLTKLIPARRSHYWQRRLLARYARNLALHHKRSFRVPLRHHRRGARHRGRQLRLGCVGDRLALSAPADRRAIITTVASRATRSGSIPASIRLRRRLPSTKRRCGPSG